MIRRFIEVKHQVIGFHCWPDAPEQRSYLADIHRHVFHITAKMEVYDSDREIEFHDFLDHIRTFATSSITTELHSHSYMEAERRNTSLSDSCETIAQNILIDLQFVYGSSRFMQVSVSEDNECTGYAQYGQ